jgi:hypothetical protein
VIPCAGDQEAAISAVGELRTLLSDATSSVSEPAGSRHE